jgi:energy-coupling factor transport system substrate-specific component
VGTVRITRTSFTLTVASVVGAACFLYPFVLPAVRQASDENRAHGTAAPLLFAIVTAMCLVVMLASLVDNQGIARSRTVALLGVLVAVDATLRLVPSVLGASPVFLLIILVGVVFGSAMGFQMGVLTLFFSALITGGIGPWLPFQMLGAGWIGLTAGWLPQTTSPRRRLVMVAAFGAAWGLLYGILINLWFWPFAAPGVEADAGLYWSPDLGVEETIARYAHFYIVTSLPFDLFRSAGNVLLVLIFGAPVLRLLDRYRDRFSWQPWVPMEPVLSDPYIPKPEAS